MALGTTSCLGPVERKHGTGVDAFENLCSSYPRPSSIEVTKEYDASLLAAFVAQSPLRSAAFKYDGQLYCSRSEAACAVLMERYVKGFTVQNGITYQVPLARSEEGGIQCADFMVRDVLFEYHPPRFWQAGNRSGDFDSVRDYLEYVQTRKEMEKADRKAFKEETLKELSERYTASRQGLININPYLVGTELVVATSPEDFYKKIICRFCKNPPPLTKFLHNFKEIRLAVTEVKRRQAA